MMPSEADREKAIAQSNQIEELRVIEQEIKQLKMTHALRASQGIQLDIVRGAQAITQESAEKAYEKTTIDHQINDDIQKHRLVVGGEIGRWVPFLHVATLRDYRAFHPRNMVAGLPQIFRIVEGEKLKDYVGGAY